MDLYALFVALILPALRGAAFKRLRGFRDFEDRAQLAEGWAWYLLELWMRQDRAAEPWRVVEAAIRRAIANRPLPGSHERPAENGPDAMDRAVSGAGMGETRDRTPGFEYAAAVAEEFQLWWATLTPLKRRMARDLGNGMATSAAAEKYHLSQARISQLRMEFRVSWHAWWNRE